MIIRPYELKDEESWLRCRVLSFLNTAYFDHVLRKKERYENPSIELVAEVDGQIVGLLDIEYEIIERSVCSRGSGLGGMIWHIAVHPDFQRQGIATRLLDQGEELAKTHELNRLEAWTRDDEWVRKWYENQHFSLVDSYLHVFIDEQAEMDQSIQSTYKNLYPIQAFAHYAGNKKEEIRQQFKRVHECVCYEKLL
ncbi:GNAT family N-acetyltransferase [Priestia koreensis]|uniref:GNAT family N-acetyltransferase n=1 Tax=Priestia koreensis TaxID=284581 RepID=UPI0020419512|nr:GNAT family N-acetyltransferase [Priestia koreensis]MCM3003637.1 GNAT family N-acetyltransferase [Priestia koreensis]